MEISGHWYSAQSSTRHEAALRVEGKRYRLLLGEQVQAEGMLDELTFSDRIGDIARKVNWPDGAVLETPDNTRIDQILKASGHKDAGSQIFHRLENSGKFALFSLVVAVVLGFSFFKWGVPIAAKHIAWRMPISVNESISKGTFDTLEKYLFDPSAVADAQQAEITERFERLTASLPDEGFNYRLYFRNLGGIPNALALPSGQIVVTDALVDMIEHPEELDSILLHEMGHVVERHGIQGVIRGSAVSIIAALVIGDVSGTAELIAGLPVFLMESSYSRDSESEADHFAFTQMVALDMDPAFFASIMQRMSGLEQTSLEDTANGDQNLDESDANISEYFSSHPDSAARALKALEFSKRHFKN